MLPDRCSIKQGGGQCVNPPDYIISVLSDGEYMVGVTCSRHKDEIRGLLEALQAKGEIPRGKLRFSRLKSVGTDCIRADAEDLIQL